MAEVIVRPGAQADIREAALWYESRRPGLGSEFTLRFDALWNASRRIRFSFRRLEAVSLRDLFCCCSLPDCYCGSTSALPS